MNTAVSTLSGVWRGCEDVSGYYRSPASYANSAPYGAQACWHWDQGPPTPPTASRPIREAPVVPARGSGDPGTGSSVTCDKCDGAHDTSACPHFRGPRDSHQDAWYLFSGAAGSGKAHLKARECVAPRSIPRESASVVRMPGDGTCLFHSIAYGLGALGHQEDGHTIRQRVCKFIAQKQDFEISGTPLRSWVDWDSQLTVNNYCSRLAGGSFWGGAIEMAACTQIFGVDIGVYEEGYYGGGFNRISDFLCDNRPRGAVLLVYSGRAHYDALVTNRTQAYYDGGGGYSSSGYHQPTRYSNDQDEESGCPFM